MALKIKKKYNADKKLVVITILGTVGGRFNQDSKEFVFIPSTNKSIYHSNDDVIKIKKERYTNTLPLLIDSFDCEIIPVFTQDAKYVQLEVLKNLEEMEKEISVFKNGYLLEDEQDFKKVFQIIHNIVENSQYDRLIIDVTHGFRHLPLLVLIELMMLHFKDTSKIEKILFAKEEIKPIKENNFVGKYDLIDLKEYLDIANISFILTNFDKNFTVANHIKSEKYQNLINALNDFSNDIMALNLNGLFEKSSKRLIEELKKINDVSIISQSEDLLEKIDNMTNYNDKKRYRTYYDLAELLVDKNYILLSMSLLYESIRLYIKTMIKKSHKELVEKVEKALNNDLYKIGDFFIKFKDDYTYEKLQKKSDYKNIITQKEFNQIKIAFPKIVLNQYKFNINYNKDKSLLDTISHSRNSLAHATSQKSFEDIKKNIQEILEKYKEVCIEK
jgi:CRISPR-associated DxTHG motif protein